MNGKKAKQLRKLFPGNESAYFHAKKKYILNKSTERKDLMRTKEEITIEFNQVKNAKEDFENKVKSCEVRLAQLQGQFELLDQMEKEKTEKPKKKTSEVL